MNCVLKRTARELTRALLLGTTALAIGIDCTSISAGAETIVERKTETAGMSATGSATPDTKVSETKSNTSVADGFDDWSDVAEIQRQIEDIRRTVERHMVELPVTRVPVPDHFDIPLLPTDHPRFVKPPIAQLWFPVFPQPPHGSAAYRRAWQQRSASSWSQQGSRFCYEQPVRGVVVRLSGHLKNDSLAIEKIEVVPSDAKSAKAFGAVSDVPEAYRDEVEAACDAARQYVEKRTQ